MEDDPAQIRFSLIFRESSLKSFAQKGRDSLILNYD